VFVGFHHFSVVVCGSSKEDIVFSGEFTRDGDLVERNFVAGSLAVAPQSVTELAYKAISRCKSVIY
jgi:hypothetical protein